MSADLAALKAELLSRTGRGAEYGLQRIEAALEGLGHPERACRVVHVGGTNGKGSVCAMLTAILRAAGKHTGTFTSPHLCHLAERIRLDGEPIDDTRFAAALATVLDPRLPALTFFEAMTAAGFVAMRDAGVDLAVFEVGLGGRLDATNVVPEPRVTAVVSVGLDHTRILGEDTATIAREKAAIAKPGVPFVLGPMDDAARDASEELALARGADPIWIYGRDFALEEDASGISVRTPDGLSHAPSLALDGPHQRRNAAVAIALCHLLARRGDLPRDLDACIAEGLRTASWPGRLERVERDGVTVLLDCAHNSHAVEALTQALGDLDPARSHLVFGALGDKSWQEMLAGLAPLAARRYYCPPIVELAGRLPAPPSALAESQPGAAFDAPEAAIDAALAAASPGDTILVTGSIFLVGAVRVHLVGGPRDVAVAL